MKKFYVNGTLLRIEPRDISRETESSVYFNSKESGWELRHAKTTESSGYFDIWREARDFLINMEETKIATLTRELARRQENIKKIEEMKE